MRCLPSGNWPDGDSCGEGAVCTDGLCEPCNASEACTPANPCHAGRLACDQGRRCVETGGLLADGETCGDGQVCKGGQCGPCREGTACREACFVGTIACATGSPVCRPTMGLPDRTPCGEGSVCIAGQCTVNAPVRLARTIVGNWTSGRSLVLSGGELFWTQGPTVMHMPREGGTPVLIGTAGTASMQSNLAVVGGHVYWGQDGGGDGTGTLFRDGAAVAMALNQIVGLGTDGTTLYLVVRNAPASSSIDTLSGSLFRTAERSAPIGPSLVVDPTHVFFSSSGTWRVARSGASAPEPVLPGGCSVPLRVRSGQLYVEERVSCFSPNGLARVSVEGGPLTHFVSACDGNAVYASAEDADRLYFGCNDIIVYLGDGESELQFLHRGHTPTSMAVDEQYLYFIDKNSGELLRIWK